MSDTEGDAYRRFANAYGHAWAPRASEIAAAIVMAEDRKDADDAPAPLPDQKDQEEPLEHAAETD